MKFARATAAVPAHSTCSSQGGQLECILTEEKQAVFFCDSEKMQAASQARRSNRLTEALKIFRVRCMEMHDRALARVRLFLGEVIGEDFAKRATAARGRGKDKVDAWQACLAHRKLAGRPLNKKQRKNYEALVARDQRVARRTIFFPTS